MLVATAIALMGMVSMAGPASAHHSTISGTATCGTAPNTYTIAWKVQNWSDRSDQATNVGTVTSSSRGVVPVGASFANGETRTYTETVTGTSPVTLTVGMVWKQRSSITATDSGTVSVFPECVESVTATAPTLTPPTCSDDGRLGVPADTAKVDYAVSPASTGPGTYTVTATAEPGYELTGTTTWTLTVAPKRTGEECWESVTPVAPTVRAVAGCDTEGAITFATTEGVTYALTRGDGRYGAYEVVATAEPGYQLAPGVTATRWTGDLGARTTCVTPARPAVTEPSCTAAGTLVLPAGDNVDYTVSPAHTGPGTYTVTATAEPGHEIVGVSRWELVVAPARTDGCAAGAIEPPTPTTPTSTTSTTKSPIRVPLTPATPAGTPAMTPAMTPTGTPAGTLPATGAGTGLALGALAGTALLGCGVALVLRRRVIE
ncbi:hypothetical protein FHP29_13595 [Nocardioides albidus]|uniref:Gram-positive cocci surface proteins LPxTG domain-containing protein n=1 Tax=Nocardioides albidus TaxID=1517589 RepID=A0A5C4VRY0_9ACTN|nr:hypothetical protein [Nocardioides albidus]TNM38305.1 hypothetical protein FHP29_13595 [Nocardioides albidus]